MNQDSIEKLRHNPFDPLWDFTARKSILYIRFAEKKSHGRKHFEAPSNTHTVTQLMPNVYLKDFLPLKMICGH